jgi:hypothetical protein
MKGPADTQLSLKHFEGGAAHEAPSGEIEEVIAKFWKDLLRLERVGRDDNFFALGGTSRVGMAAARRTGEACAVQLDFAAIFGHPTIREMAQLIARLQSENRSSPLPAATGEEGII